MGLIAKVWFSKNIFIYFDRDCGPRRLLVILNCSPIIAIFVSRWPGRSPPTLHRTIGSLWTRERHRSHPLNKSIASTVRARSPLSYHRVTARIVHSRRYFETISVLPIARISWNGAAAAGAQRDFFWMIKAFSISAATSTQTTLLGVAAICIPTGSSNCRFCPQKSGSVPCSTEFLLFRWFI